MIELGTHNVHAAVHAVRFLCLEALPATLMPLTSNALSLKTSHDRGSLSQLIDAKRVPPRHQQLEHHALL